MTKRMIIKAGNLDTTFGKGGKKKLKFNFGSAYHANSLTLASEGRIFIAGDVEQPSGDDLQQNFAITCLNQKGEPYLPFNNGYMADRFNPDDARLASACQRIFITGSKVVLAGVFTNDRPTDVPAFARLNMNGRYDEPFGRGGRYVYKLPCDPSSSVGASPTSIDRQSTGHFVFAFEHVWHDLVTPHALNSTAVLARISQDAKLDNNFARGNGHLTIKPAPGHNFRKKGLIIQNDDRILVFGELSGESSDAVIYRFTADGEIDPSFGREGELRKPDWNITSIVALPGDRLLCAGSRGDQALLARLKADGSDDTFRSEVKIHDRCAWLKALQQPDNTTLVVGYAEKNLNVVPLLARFLDNAELDPNFGEGQGWVSDGMGNMLERAIDLAVDDIGRILVLGKSQGLSPYADFFLLRYQGSNAKERSITTISP